MKGINLPTNEDNDLSAKIASEEITPRSLRTASQITQS
jgi:hypothetical protein